MSKASFEFHDWGWVHWSRNSNDKPSGCVTDCLPGWLRARLTYFEICEASDKNSEIMWVIWKVQCINGNDIHEYYTCVCIVRKIPHKLMVTETWTIIRDPVFNLHENNQRHSLIYFLISQVASQIVCSSSLTSHIASNKDTLRNFQMCT